MQRTIVIGCAALVIGAGAPLGAQERPGSAADERRSIPSGTTVQDTMLVDTAHGPRLRLNGEVLTDLPVDDALGLLRFFPGFMQTGTGAVTYRAVNGWVASYVDGVPVRSMIGSGPGLVPSLNALSAVSLTGNGVSASRMGAAVVDYTTRSGGDRWTGNIEVHSDALSPGEWNQRLANLQLVAAGPVPGLSGLHFSAAGRLAGQQYTQLPDGGPAVYFTTGVDTTFTLARTGGDSVEVTVPEYEQWDYDELPLGSSDRSDLTTALTLKRSEGEYGLRYYRSSMQRTSKALDHLYNPDAWRGLDDLAQVLSLTAERSLPLGLTFDAAISHQRYDVTRGMLDPAGAAGNAHPSFGINFGSLDFIADREDWPVTEPVLLALRSGVLPVNLLTFTTSNNPLGHLRQGVLGVSQSLRLNPYGARSGFPISGMGATDEAAGAWSTERHWYGRAAVSRRAGVHTLGVGAELDRGRVETMRLPLASGIPVASRERPEWAAAFVHASTTLKGIQASAGVRFERHSSDALLPRVPGFFYNVPDSLRGDAYILTAGDGPWEQRLERVVDCGGAATAASRTNQVTGALVCHDNMVPVQTHSVVSPRIAIDYAGEDRFSVRAAYGSYVQPRSMTIVTGDVTSTGTGTVHSRDTEPVRENVAELGLRFRTLEDSWVDVQLFRLDIANPIVQRSGLYDNPNNGAPIFLPVLINGESQATRGIEVSALQRIASSAGLLAIVAYNETGERSFFNPDGPLRAASVVWLDMGGFTPILVDLTVHMTASYVSGGRFTRLVNQGNGNRAGRINDPAFGEAAEEPGSSRLPSRKEFDVRVAKAFRIAGTRARIVADLRNPLGLENVHTLFAETGTTDNPLFRDQQSAIATLEYSGTGTVTDRVIDEWPENELNRYMLRRAEQRFGNGDGIFTVSEMRAAVDSYVALMDGPQYMRDRGRELRLGIEVTF